MQFLINIIILLIIAYLIGEERMNSGKVLGFRSISLVMLGAFIFTYLSCEDGVIKDWHVIAQIVTGISFVGAGLILKDQSVRNLTTAILVWTMAAVGVLIGLNMLLEAIIVSLVILFILSHKKN